MNDFNYIQHQLIEWVKKFKHPKGDNYKVRITNKGKWAVIHSDKYFPSNNSGGNEFILTEIEFNKAITWKIK